MRIWKWTLTITLVLAGCGTDEGSADGTDADLDCERGVRCAADVATGPNGDPNRDGGNDENDAGATDVRTADLGPSDTGGNEDASNDDIGPRCERTPAPANRDRKVVVAHPFTDTEYEVLDLDRQGTLTRPGVIFSMGAGHEGEIQFTPDGEVGYAVQDGGTLGVFRFNDNGDPEVLDAFHDPGFYVSGALIDAAGDNLYAWEVGWRKTDDGQHNGAMYRLPLDCASGMPGEPEEFFRGKLIRGAAWLSASRLGVAADDLLDDETPNDAHLVDIAGPTRVASAAAFSDEGAITAGFDLTNDGNYMLVGDNSAFTESPNSVAVLEIGDAELSLVQTIEIDDPVEIVTSPFDNAAIVLSTTGDAIQVISYEPGADPFTLRGPLQTTDPTLLPLGVSMIRRGDLEGRVIVGENVAVRQVQFESDGTVTDLGILEFGGGNDAITGAVGVQP